MGASSRYLFANPTTSKDAKTITRVKFNIMTKHADLLTTIISDKASAFVWQVIKEVADVLEITLEDATTKHAQTTGVYQKTHAKGWH